ncbi:MG319/MPN454 family protein [Mycoplasma bradburyae]|uniref:Uncharacterized protein n=1 Tax=Mycoplasma bradburyae TaxID=2963128 RepID=A0ABT5GCE0_9MOLU|nr:hypothetical protein [Mycoplasma bradburyae]MDC4163532.1 hypothetical protein [Mycoplasma bradburyae]MDC4182130.1 hypothetical protein [Mycoplasma bradburyae]MDC4184316.1 hypothetical protein [Mycoplasma bradburyae]UTS70301.1 hypothetical protein NMG68_00950 [Mycoplasma bradburyae]UTS71025.1 hypothetical protein NMG77_00935 [Mycoplasma bradburyae]
MSYKKSSGTKKALAVLGFFFLFMVLLLVSLWAFFAFFWFKDKYNPVTIYNNFFSEDALNWFNVDKGYEWGAESYKQYATMLPDSDSILGKIGNFIPFLYTNKDIFGIANQTFKVSLLGYVIPFTMAFGSSLIITSIVYVILKIIIKLIVKSNDNKNKALKKKSYKTNEEAKTTFQASSQSTVPFNNSNTSNIEKAATEFYDSVKPEIKYDASKDWKALSTGANMAEREKQFYEHMKKTSAN